MYNIKLCFTELASYCTYSSNPALAIIMKLGILYKRNDFDKRFKDFFTLHAETSFLQ